MYTLQDLLDEFEPKPTFGQLEYIKVIEKHYNNDRAKFKGKTFEDARKFISKWRIQTTRWRDYASYYGGGYCNYDEDDIALSSSGFDVMDFY